MTNEDSPAIYEEGLKAGAIWFNLGIDFGIWEVPTVPPSLSPEMANEWERGLDHGFGDLEDAYYS